jgi:outer membrane protein OmpA-like peptidoglycan-associated protein
MRNQAYLAGLIAVALGAGCAVVPPEGSPLAVAHDAYAAARTDPHVSQLGAVELNQAADSLDEADTALRRGQNAEADRLAYVARQKVAIAEQTARRKLAEMAVADATAQRDRVRLEARTAEAEAARRETDVARQRAQTQAERDQALLAEREAELAATRRESAEAQQAAALAEANARNEQRVAQEQAQAEAARQQAASAQQAAATAQETAAQEQAAAEAARAQAEQQRAAAEAARSEAAQQRSTAEETRALAEQNQARLAEQNAQLEALNAQRTERGVVITLGDVLFGVNEKRLSPGGARNLEKLADFLKRYPERRVLVEGHTDGAGSETANQALSEQRAEAVRGALVEMGVERERIDIRGYGEGFPLASNATAAGRQLNRRVEIVLSDDTGKVEPRAP